MDDTTLAPEATAAAAAATEADRREARGDILSVLTGGITSGDADRDRELDLDGELDRELDLDLDGELDRDGELDLDEELDRDRELDRDGDCELDRDGDGIAGSGGGQGTHDAPRLPELPRARRINGDDPGGGKAGPTPAAAAAATPSPSWGCCPGLQHLKYLLYTRRVASVARLNIAAPPRLRLFLVLMRCRRVRIMMN